MPLFIGHLLRTWPPDMRSENYLTFLSRSETSVWLVLCDIGITAPPRPPPPPPPPAGKKILRYGHAVR